MHDRQLLIHRYRQYFPLKIKNTLYMIIYSQKILLAILYKNKIKI
jgi:hypothetical protein